MVIEKIVTASMASAMICSSLSAALPLSMVPSFFGTNPSINWVSPRTTKASRPISTTRTHSLREYSRALRTKVLEKRKSKSMIAYLV